MSQENVELVRLLWEAFARSDVEAMQALSHPDVVIAQPAEMPDPRRYEGHAGVAESIADWPSQWEDFTLDVLEIVDASDEQVVLMTHQSGRGRGSGIELDFEVAFVHTIHDGKFSHVQMFLERGQALQSVGL